MQCNLLRRVEIQLELLLRRQRGLLPACSALAGPAAIGVPRGYARKHMPAQDQISHFVGSKDLVDSLPCSFFRIATAALQKLAARRWSHQGLSTTKNL